MSIPNLAEDPFWSIRPFHDDEVFTVIKRLTNNQQLHYSLTKLLYPNLANWLINIVKPFVGYKLKRKTSHLKSVSDVQNYMRPYLVKNLEQTTSNITFSGIENLAKNKAYVFISNHKDIVMDPALINYLLDKHGCVTPRLAIGDNLLQQDFVADLMRLNKCFIVKRGLTNRREKLAAAKLLAEYIYHSLTLDKSCVWIAQAEGRAKNGNDKTNPALLKMLQLANSQQDFSEFITSLNLVAVSISYEFDPCDMFKAYELQALATFGAYLKKAGEDERSIAKGVTGFKGRVHVNFTPLTPNNYADAEQLATRLDNLIYSNYQLYPLNYWAYSLWQEKPSNLIVPSLEELFTADEILQVQQIWQQKTADLPLDLLPYLIIQYAYPVHNFYLTTKN